MTNAWPYTCLIHTFQEQKMTKEDISLTTVASYAFNPKKQKQQHIITPIKKKKKTIIRAPQQLGKFWRGNNTLYILSIYFFKSTF